jgi:DNA-binding transcriptional MerR regulator
MSSNNIISTFSAEYAAKITGFSPRQLSYWDKIGFFKPSVMVADNAQHQIRIYSFNDLVGLRVVCVLQKQHKMSIQKLRKAAEQLEKYSRTPWSSLRLMVCKGEISFIDPNTGLGKGAITNQGVFVEIIDEIKHVNKLAKALNQRSESQIGTTERHRNVVHNMLVFAGTRVPIRAVERFLAAGYSTEQILEEYPSLSHADIEVARQNMNKLNAA